MRLLSLTPITGSGEDMFDAYVTTQTETADEISKTFSVAGFNCVAILNNEGVTATLTFLDSSDTRITEDGDTRITEDGDTRITETIQAYKTRITESGKTRITEDGKTRITEGAARAGEVQTVSLIRDSIKDWWDYWFAPTRRGRDCVFYFPTQPVGTEAILTITYPGGTAKCGLAITGYWHDIATTLQNVKIGITDYSKVQTDTFGQTYLKPGNWAKRAEAAMFLYNTSLDIAYREIVKNRGVACIFDYNEYDAALTEESILYEAGGSALEDSGGNALYVYGGEDSGRYTSDAQHQSLIVYGLTEAFEPRIKYPSASVVTHESRGLI